MGTKKCFFVELKFKYRLPCLPYLNVYIFVHMCKLYNNKVCRNPENRDLNNNNQRPLEENIYHLLLDVYYDVGYSTISFTAA